MIFPSRMPPQQSPYMNRAPAMMPPQQSSLIPPSATSGAGAGGAAGGASNPLAAEEAMAQETKIAETKRSIVEQIKAMILDTAKQIAERWLR